jgi:hypothetical protein
MTAANSSCSWGFHASATRVPAQVCRDALGGIFERGTGHLSAALGTPEAMVNWLNQAVISGLTPGA